MITFDPPVLEETLHTQWYRAEDFENIFDELLLILIEKI